MFSNEPEGKLKLCTKELISTYCLFMKKIQQSINELDTESDVLKHFCDLMLSGY